jgi:putative GTP pyrophosphokinase
MELKFLDYIAIPHQEAIMEATSDFKFFEILESDHPEILVEQTQPFSELMMNYQCALQELETKLQILNREFLTTQNRNPIENIKTRIKSPLSIINKLKSRGLPITIANMEKNIFDIAGARVVCSFPEDIYTIAGFIKQQDDIQVKVIKDYIKNPKANGYRSLHMIIEIPIFLSDKKKWMAVEVQFRTIAMDFWASLEHKLRYKKDIKDEAGISQALLECAQTISEMDLRMQEIRNMIDAEN